MPATRSVPRRTLLQAERHLQSVAKISAEGPVEVTKDVPTAISSTDSIKSPKLQEPQPLLSAIQVLAEPLIPSLTGLPRAAHALLMRKQAELRSSMVGGLQDSARLPVSSAAAATFVFAQEEAGTAVCVAPEGLLLTCAHCVAETADELAPARRLWLLGASGQAVAATCLAWDARRDLALLRIVAASATAPSAGFAFCRVGSASPHPGAPLLCVGQPGAEDLEASTPGQQTGYAVLHVSTGRYRGLAPECEADPQDNSDIGALMHDCWTYWGHSGAPLVERRTGMLVGLHSSWDDETGMRRGVPLEAIRAFLAEHGVLISAGVGA